MVIYFISCFQMIHKAYWSINLSFEMIFLEWHFNLLLSSDTLTSCLIIRSKCLDVCSSVGWSRCWYVECDLSRAVSAGAAQPQSGGGPQSLGRPEDPYDAKGNWAVQRARRSQECAIVRVAVICKGIFKICRILLYQSHQHHWKYTANESCKLLWHLRHSKLCAM